MSYIEADFDTVFLFPPTLNDWVPADHPARFIHCFVEGLDLQALGISLRDVGTAGRPAFAPQLLLRVWLYGYFKKKRSSRQLEEACREDTGFMWLCGGLKPDHNTIWRFWKNNRAFIRKLFKESVLVSARMNLVGLTLQAVDGSKIPALCHAGKAYDEADLTKRIERLDSDLEALEKEIAEAEASAQAPSPALPKELEDKKKLKEAMEKAREELARNPKVNHIHPLEPEARRMKTPGGRRSFSYNGQIVVDSENQIIVAADVVNEVNDLRQLTPMLNQAEENLAAYREEQAAAGVTMPTPVSLADAGYPSAEQISAAEEAGHQVVMPLPPTVANDEGKKYHASNFTYDAEADAFVCPEGRRIPFQRVREKDNGPVRVYRSASVCKNCPAFGTCTKDRHGRTIDLSPWHDAVVRHREKMDEEENRRLLKERPRIVEPVFGQIKANGLFWRWTYGGLEKVGAQWALLCTAWNLRVMYRAWREKISPEKPGKGKGRRQKEAAMGRAA